MRIDDRIKLRKISERACVYIILLKMDCAFKTSNYEYVINYYGDIYSALSE